MTNKPTPLTNLRNSWVLIRRSIRRDMRSVDALITAIVLPIMILILFSIVFGGAVDTGMHYVSYVIPGIFLLCVSFGTASTAVSVFTDAATGLTDRFRSLPISSASVLTGHVVSSIVRNTLAMVVVVLLALAIGFRPNANPLEWLAAFGLLWLVMLAFTWGAAAFGLLVKSIDAASSFMFVTMLFPYISSAFVPLHTLPDWLQGFAHNQPMSHLVEAMRGLLLGGPLGDHIWLSVVWCLAIALAAYVAARLLFRRRSA